MPSKLATASVGSVGPLARSAALVSPSRRSFFVLCFSCVCVCVCLFVCALSSFCSFAFIYILLGCKRSTIMPFASSHF